MPPAAPHIPEYELLRPIGEGSYGAVWLARGVTGVFRAVKIVRRDSFSHDRPFDREFLGIQKFEPVSRSQANLLNIFHAGRNSADGFFYYVMEIGDCRKHGSEVDPADYHPRSLGTDLREKKRLSFGECLSMGHDIASALDHMHRSGLVHRDVKPANIIFAAGVAKLADIGLVASTDESRSFVGTEGFVPPDGPGTPRADAFALGKVLYECSTGKDRTHFPQLPPDWNHHPEHAKFLELNEIILKACEPDPRRAYRGAADMLADLSLLQSGRSVRRLRAFERRVAILTRVGAAAGVVSLLMGAGWMAARGEAKALRTEIADVKRDAALAETRRDLAYLKDGIASASLRLLEDSLPRARAQGAPPVELRSAAISALAAQLSHTRQAAPGKTPGLSPDGRWLARIRDGAVLFSDNTDPRGADIPAAERADGLAFTDALYIRRGEVWTRRALTPRGDGSDRLAPEAPSSAPPEPAAGSSPFTAEARDGLVHFLSRETGELLATIQEPGGGAITAALRSGDGHFLVTLTEDGAARVWPMAKMRRRLEELKLDFPVPPLSHPAYDTTKPGALSMDDKTR